MDLIRNLLRASALFFCLLISSFSFSQGSNESGSFVCPVGADPGSSDYSCSGSTRSLGFISDLCADFSSDRPGLATFLDAPVGANANCFRDNGRRVFGCSLEQCNCPIGSVVVRNPDFPTGICTYMCGNGSMVTDPLDCNDDGSNSSGDGSEGETGFGDTDDDVTSPDDPGSEDSDNSDSESDDPDAEVVPDDDGGDGSGGGSSGGAGSGSGGGGGGGGSSSGGDDSTVGSTSGDDSDNTVGTDPGDGSGGSNGDGGDDGSGGTCDPLEPGYLECIADLNLDFGEESVFDIDQMNELRSDAESRLDSTVSDITNQINDIFSFSFNSSPSNFSCNEINIFGQSVDISLCRWVDDLSVLSDLILLIGSIIFAILVLSPRG